MKRTLSILLTLSLLLSSVVFASATPTVSSEGPSTTPVSTAKQQVQDELTGKWFETAMRYAISSGALSGYADGYYRPEAKITRGAMAIILQRLFNYSANPGQAEFSDVPYASPYRAGVMATASNGVITGFSNGTFKPTANITRQQAAVMLARALTVPSTESVSLSFTDSADVAGYARSAVSYMKAKGFMNGNQKNLFRPNDFITRAEAATVLYNARTAIAKTSGNTVESAVELKDKKTYTTDYDSSVRIMSAGITLEGVNIKGSLYIDKAVGSGDVYLKNVAVTGKVYVQGGGSNSIHYSGSTFGNTTFEITSNNRTRVVCDNGRTSNSRINSIIVNTSAGTIIECPARSVSVLAGSGSTELKSNIDSVNSATSSQITVASGSTVKDMYLTSKPGLVRVEGEVTTLTGDSDTENTSIYVTGKINKASLSGVRSTVQGTGIVNYVEAKANNISVSTRGTSVTASRGITGVTAGGKTVIGGSTLATDGSGTINGVTINVTGVTLDSSTASVEVGSRITLGYSVTPINGNVESINWSTSNSSIATVNSGIVTGVKAGTCVITLNLNGYSRQCTITVTALPVPQTPIEYLNSHRVDGSLTLAQITNCLPAVQQGVVSAENLEAYKAQIAKSASPISMDGLYALVTDVNFYIINKYDILAKELSSVTSLSLSADNIALWADDSSIFTSLVRQTVLNELDSYTQGNKAVLKYTVESKQRPINGSSENLLGVDGYILYNLWFETPNGRKTTSSSLRVIVVATPYKEMTAEQALAQIKSYVLAEQTEKISAILLERTGCQPASGLSYTTGLAKYQAAFAAAKTHGDISQDTEFTTDFVNSVVAAVQQVHVTVGGVISNALSYTFSDESLTTNMSVYFPALSAADYVAYISDPIGANDATLQKLSTAFKQYVVAKGARAEAAALVTLSDIKARTSPTATTYGKIDVSLSYTGALGVSTGLVKLTFPVNIRSGATPLEILNSDLLAGLSAHITLNEIKEALTSQQYKTAVIADNLDAYRSVLANESDLSEAALYSCIVDGNWIKNYILYGNPTVANRLITAIPARLTLAQYNLSESTARTYVRDSALGGILGISDSGIKANITASTVSFVADGKTPYVPPTVSSEGGLSSTSGSLTGRLVITAPGGAVYKSDEMTIILMAT